MAGPLAHRGNPALAAMLTSCALMVHQVAADAASDALFLSHFPVARLPVLMIVSAALSMVIVLASSAVMRRRGPAGWISGLFDASAAILLGVWGLSFIRPGAAAVALYVFSFAVEPVLISAFWSLISERFDPRTARLQMGRIAGLGMLGGVIGGVLGERVGSTWGVAAVIPVLAALQLLAMVTVRGIGVPIAEAAEPPPAGEGQELLAGIRVLSRVAFLRNLALLVLLGSVTAMMLDYAFKSAASQRFTDSHALMRLFSIFYTAVSIVAFGVQTLISGAALERLGLARSVAALPVITGVACLGALWMPGLEVVLRSSLFRSAYELLFAPIAPADKRATKSIVDVGFENAGDLVGGGLLAVFVAVAATASRTSASRCAPSAGGRWPRSVSVTPRAGSIASRWNRRC